MSRAGAKRSGIAATIIGVVCGAELVVVALIGGAGLGSLLGWEAGLFALLAVVPAGVLVAGRRRTKRRGVARPSGDPGHRVDSLDA